MIGDTDRAQPRRRWRFYRTPTGRDPVRDFLDALDERDAVAILAGLRDVEARGREAARHLRGEIHEVRVAHRGQQFRILFAAEGRSRHILLALEGFSKKTERTPPQLIDLAEQRLADWRSRGRERF